MKKMTSACASLALLTTTLAPGLAKAETWSFTVGWPPGHFMVKNGVEPWMQCVDDATDGEIEFNLFPSGQISGEPGIPDALKGGLANVGYIGIHAMSDKMPLTMLTMLPGIGDSAVQISSAIRDVLIEDGGAIHDQVIEYGLQPMLATAFPPYQLGLAGDPVTTMENLSGLKIRTSGGSLVLAMQALNAVPVQLPASDAYVAMQQGTVDGYVLAPPSITSYKLEELSGSVSRNFNIASTTGFFAMDKQRFDSLSEDLQATLLKCGKDVEAALAAKADGEVESLLASFEEQGINIYSFSDEEVAKIKKTIQPVTDDLVKRISDQGLDAQEALDEFMAAIEKHK
tara:strand:- start:29439 stop:30464 length:1026 start_codon:yes stop_codon:yes gene_type:complete